MRAKKKQIQPRSGPERAFGEVLRSNRRKSRLSQEKLAFESGLNRTTVSLLERGLISPSLRTMVRVGRVLQLSLSELGRQIEASRFL